MTFIALIAVAIASFLVGNITGFLLACFGVVIEREEEE